MGFQCAILTLKIFVILTGKLAHSMGKKLPKHCLNILGIMVSWDGMIPLIWYFTKPPGISWPNPEQLKPEFRLPQTPAEYFWIEPVPMDSGGGGSDVRLTSFVVDHHDTTQNDVMTYNGSLRIRTDLLNIGTAAGQGASSVRAKENSYSFI